MDILIWNRKNLPQLKTKRRSGARVDSRHSVAYHEDFGSNTELY
jgi:hypothetical protein